MQLNPTHQGNARHLHATMQWIMRQLNTKKKFARRSDGSPSMLEHISTVDLARLIPILFNYSVVYQRTDMTANVEAMVSLLLESQHAEGWIPLHGIYRDNEVPSIAITAGCALGALAAGELLHRPELATLSHRAASWIAQHPMMASSLAVLKSDLAALNESSMVTWLLLHVEKAYGDHAVGLAGGKAALVLTDQLLGRSPELARAMIHGDHGGVAIRVQTLNAFLELGNLSATCKTIRDTGIKILMQLLRRFETKKDLHWVTTTAAGTDRTLRNLESEGGLAICWLRLYHITGDARLLNAACKLIGKITRLQFISAFTPSVLRGALFQTWPPWHQGTLAKLSLGSAINLVEAMLLQHHMLEQQLTSEPR